MHLFKSPPEKDQEVHKKVAERHWMVDLREQTAAPWDNICKATGKPKDEGTWADMIIMDEVTVPQPVTTPAHSSDGGTTDYYAIPPGTRDLDDLIADKGMSFRMGNIFKACYRFGKKGGTSQLYDLNKIIFFAERERERLVKGQ